MGTAAGAAGRAVAVGVAGTAVAAGVTGVAGVRGVAWTVFGAGVASAELGVGALGGVDVDSPQPHKDTVAMLATRVSCRIGLNIGRGC